MPVRPVVPPAPNMCVMDADGASTKTVGQITVLGHGKRGTQGSAGGK